MTTTEAKTSKANGLPKPGDPPLTPEMEEDRRRNDAIVLSER